MSKLSFDDVHHEYVLEGRKVPSVTTIINTISEDLALSSAFRRKAEIGTLVHDLCDEAKKGIIHARDDIREDLWPYYAGYLKFMEKSGYKNMHSELRVYSTKYRYAGTLDDINIVPKGTHLALMDIKTTATLNPLTALQTAAYLNAVEEMVKAGLIDLKGMKIKQRSTIWLTGDEKYEIAHYKDETDFNIFLCKLTSYNWDRKHGL